MNSVSDPAYLAKTAPKTELSSSPGKPPTTSTPSVESAPSANSTSPANPTPPNGPTPSAGTAPPAEQAPPDGTAPSHTETGEDALVHFALRCDGAILLNAADLKGFDLSGREVFTGIVLTPRETRFTILRLGNAAADAAAKLLASLLKSLSKLRF